VINGDEELEDQVSRTNSHPVDPPMSSHTRPLHESAQLLCKWFSKPPMLPSDTRGFLSCGRSLAHKHCRFAQEGKEGKRKGHKPENRYTTEYACFPALGLVLLAATQFSILQNTMIDILTTLLPYLLIFLVSSLLSFFLML
jgi:hypothetical protein